MINEQLKKFWRLSSGVSIIMMLFPLALNYQLFYQLHAESPQTRSIIDAILGIIFLSPGLAFFALCGLKCFVIMLAPERVTAHFDKYHFGMNNTSWIEYNYGYRGTQHTGKGRALDFNELTPPNTPFTLCVSRINPNFSYRGDPRVGLLFPLLFLALNVAVSGYAAFESPKIAFRAFNFSRDHVPLERFQYSSITQGAYKFGVPHCSSGYTYFYKIFNEDSFQNVSKTHRNLKHSTPIESETHGFDISAIGMTTMPMRLSLNPGMQPTTLYVENDSHAPIQVNHLRQNGTPVPQTFNSTIHIPSGSRCDWLLFGPIPWQFMSGKTVLGVLASTSQTGYVSIRDTQ